MGVIRQTVAACLALGLSYAPAAIAAPAAPLDIIIDADYSISGDGARAIEAGVRAALAQTDYTIGGLPVRVVTADHRGNAKRSFRTIRAYLESDTALFVVGGVHSPPYLTHREYINENGALLLLPWSAAGPITRAQAGDTNWIFRLSVDDSKAGGYLVRKAVDEYGCTNVGLLLIDTAWGRSNRVALTAELTARGLEPGRTIMMPSVAGHATAAAVAEELASSGADCAIMLANTTGAIVANELARVMPALRLISHWGILAGDFAGAVPHPVREQLQLTILQTCGLEAEADGRPMVAASLAEYSRGRPQPSRLSDIPGSTGFVHGFDLIQIIHAAADGVSATPDWRSGDIKTRRALLRDALETIERPVEGILKSYVAPFGPYDLSRPDAHEALGEDDLCMAHFAEDGRLLPGRRN